MLPGTAPSQPPLRPLIEWPCTTQQGLPWWLSPRLNKWLLFVLSCDSRFRQCTNPQAAAINFLLLLCRSVQAQIHQVGTSYTLGRGQATSYSVPVSDCDYQTLDSTTMMVTNTGCKYPESDNAWTDREVVLPGITQYQVKLLQPPTCEERKCDDLSFICICCLKIWNPTKKLFSSVAVTV